MNLISVIALVLFTVPFLAILRRDWVIRRLALRNIGRRPVESMLLILGALFGTAIITASFVVGDTLDSSIRSSAFSELGEIDEVVTTRDPTVHAQLVERLGLLDEVDGVDGALSLLTVPASVQNTSAAGEVFISSAKIIEVDFDSVEEFGSDPKASGLEGETPGPENAVISDYLADELDAAVGDEIVVYVLGQELQLTVDAIVEQRGIAGLSLGVFDLGRNLFLAPGTVDGLVAESDVGAAALSIERSVAVSNQGDVLGGAGLSDDVAAAMEVQVVDLGPVVRPVKAELVATAEQTSAELGDLFFAMGAFGGLAGVLLVVNLFVMLAEERKVQLGMFRALGMTQGALVRAFSVEGWFYGMIAATLGAVAGLGLGRAIVVLVARSIDELGSGIGLELAFAFDWASVRDGFLLGLAVSTATVFVAGIRFARVNVISAIRDLPAPRRTAQSQWIPVAAAVGLFGGVGWSIYAFVADDAVGIVIGPILAAMGVTGLLVRFVSARIVGTALAAASMIWAVVAIRVVVEGVEDPGVNVFVVQGVVLTASAVVLVSLHQHHLGSLARSQLRGPRSMVLSLGVAYPLSRPVRTALTVGMYALVVFTLTFITVLSGIFDNQLDETAAELSGGSDIVVSSVTGNPIPIDEIAAHGDVLAVAPLVQQPILIVDPADPTADPVIWFATAFDEQLVEIGAPELRAGGGYEADEDVYRAVLEDENLAIIDPLLATTLVDTVGRVEIGSNLTLVDPVSGTVRTVEIVATSPTDLVLNGLLISSPISPPELLPPPTRAYVAVSPSVADPELLAAELSQEYAIDGVEAETIQSIVDRASNAQSQFFELARGYLALGMVVGVAGLGVVLVRAVRERRRQVGVLRSLGLLSGPIGWSFIVEAAVVAIEGTAIGVALGILTAYNIITATTLVGLDVAFVVPAGDIAVLVAFVIVTSLLMTVVPARRASRIRPAVALRIAD